MLFAGAIVVGGERGPKGVFIVLVAASFLLDIAAAFIWPDAIGVWIMDCESVSRLLIVE